MTFSRKLPAMMAFNEVVRAAEEAEREQLRMSLAGVEFTFVADPDCPKDEIRIQDEKGRILARQKITNPRA